MDDVRRSGNNLWAMLCRRKKAILGGYMLLRRLRRRGLLVWLIGKRGEDNIK